MNERYIYVSMEANDSDLFEDMAYKKKKKIFHERKNTFAYHYRRLFILWDCNNDGNDHALIFNRLQKHFRRYNFFPKRP